MWLEFRGVGRSAPRGERKGGEGALGWRVRIDGKVNAKGMRCHPNAAWANCTVLAHPAVNVFNRFPHKQQKIVTKIRLREGRAGVAALIEEKVSRGPDSSHNRVISVGQDAARAE